MYVYNHTEFKRKTIREYNRVIEQWSPEDQIELTLKPDEISVLLESGLIEPVPAKGWFDKIFWRGMQFRSTSAGYPNITIYKKQMHK